MDKLGIHLKMALKIDNPINKIPNIVPSRCIVSVLHDIGHPITSLELKDHPKHCSSINFNACKLRIYEWLLTFLQEINVLMVHLMHP